MSNTFLTMKNIAREALPVLVNNLVFPNLVHQDYSADFVGKGDTIQIEKPPVYEANDFSGTISVQDTQLSNIDVTMDKLAGSVANFLKYVPHVIIIPVLLWIGDINNEKHV